MAALLEAGANQNVPVENAPTPLHLAAMCGYSAIIEILLAHEADIHAKDIVHFTPLHCAVFFGQEKAVQTLLAHGADPNLCGGVQDRPIHIAAGKPQLNIVKILLQSGADGEWILSFIRTIKATLADDEGNTAIHFAAASGQSAILAALLNSVEEKQRVSQFFILFYIFGITGSDQEDPIWRYSATLGMLPWET